MADHARRMERDRAMLADVLRTCAFVINEFGERTTRAAIRDALAAVESRAAR
jgi:hypothetical protein